MINMTIMVTTGGLALKSSSLSITSANNSSSLLVLILQLLQIPLQSAELSQDQFLIDCSHSSSCINFFITSVLFSLTDELNPAP